MKISVSDMIVKKLKDYRTKVVFEYPGGNIAPTLDSIKRDGNIDLIVTRNDQAASLMADAYARTTGGVGVCMSTLGPGATNLVTGIANAYYDSIPVVAITGQVGLGSLRGIKDTRQMGFQEADVVSVMKPITKWAYMVKKPEDIAYIIDKAFRIAKEGRPGPVVVDIPIDIQRVVLEEDEYLEETAYIYSNRAANENKIKLLAKKISEASRPVIIAGGGVILSHAEKELKSLANAFKIPVANTLMGIGSFDQGSSLSLGFMGCYGSRWCNKSVAKADLVIGIGNRFDLRAVGTEVKRFAENKFIAHIDIDPGEINNRVKADIGIHGDAKETLKMLLDYLKNSNVKTDTSIWLEEIAELKRQYTLERDYKLQEEYEKVRPQYIIKKISESVSEKAIITGDVGQNQMWLAQFMKFKGERKHLSSGGLGNMGYGLPAAIAAKYAKEDCEVINITGDGSFQMNIQELATAREYKIPVKVFIMHNDTLGLVKQFQDRTFAGKATSTEVAYNPDFTEIARAYDAVGLKISKPEEIDFIVEKALSINDKTVIVDCIIDRDELAMPEIEGGHYMDDQYPYEG